MKTHARVHSRETPYEHELSGECLSEAERLGHREIHVVFGKEQPFLMEAVGQELKPICTAVAGQLGTHDSAQFLNCVNIGIETNVSLNV